MIAYQIIVRAKEGRTQELTDLVLSEVVAEKERGNYTRAFRAYTPEIGQPFDLVVLEWEYEDLPEYESGWAKWWSLPTTPEYMTKWDELAEPGFITKMWNLRSP